MAGRPLRGDDRGMTTATLTTEAKSAGSHSHHGPKPLDTSVAADVAARLYRYGNVHAALPSPAAVDDAAVRHFHERGFLAVENVFAPEEVEGYRRAISRVVADDRGATAGRPQIVWYEPGVDPDGLDGEAKELAVRKLFRFWDHEPALRAAGEHPALVGLCERLLGERVSMFQDMALLKPPGGGAEKPWHQDGAYFALKTPQKVIGTWTALDAATADNGCMHVIPGSHKLGPRPHYHVRDCQIPDDAVDVANDVICPLRPGGVLLFSGLLHHGTPPNLSGTRRRALQFHYMAESAVKAERWEDLAADWSDAAGLATCSGMRFKKPIRNVADRADAARTADL